MCRSWCDLVWLSFPFDFVCLLALVDKRYCFGIPSNVLVYFLMVIMRHIGWVYQNSRWVEGVIFFNFWIHQMWQIPAYVDCLYEELVGFDTKCFLFKLPQYFWELSGKLWKRHAWFLPLVRQPYWSITTAIYNWNYLKTCCHVLCSFRKNSWLEIQGLLFLVSSCIKIIIFFFLFIKDYYSFPSFPGLSELLCFRFIRSSRQTKGKKDYGWISYWANRIYSLIQYSSFIQ